MKKNIYTITLILLISFCGYMIDEKIKAHNEPEIGIVSADGHFVKHDTNCDMPINTIHYK